MVLEFAEVGGKARDVRSILWLFHWYDLGKQSCKHANVIPSSHFSRFKTT